MLGIRISTYITRALHLGVWTTMPIRTRIGKLSSMAIVLALFTGGLRSAWADVSVCEDVVSLVDHPAEYVTEKVKREGLTCILHGTCCTPYWVTDPICYALENRLSRAPWKETVHKIQCSQQDAATAIRELILNFVNPTSFVLGPLGQDLYDLYRTYVESAEIVASPLPPDVVLRLSRLLGKPGIVWSAEDLYGAKYISASDAKGALLFPGTYGNHAANAITHGNLIVIEDDVLTDTSCEKYAVFAHELTHIYQNRRDGVNTFVTKYLIDAAQHSYEEIPYEVEAYALQRRA